MKKSFWILSNTNDAIKLVQACHILLKQVLTRTFTFHSFVAAKNTPIIDFFNGMVDAASGQQVFESVSGKNERRPFGLDTQNFSCVFAQANLDYHLDGWLYNNYVFAPPNFCKQHGYDRSFPQMSDIFITSSPHVLKKGFVIPALEQL